jgi:hypothetical protein
MQMLFKDFLQYLNPNVIIHIGAENGVFWLYTGEASLVPAMYNDRIITEVYHHSGRDIKGLKPLKPGLAIIVEGDDIGDI